MSDQQTEDVTVLKLGGSVITDKDQPYTVAEEQLGRLAETIADHCEGNVVIVHGGGSFGHAAAASHGVSTTDGTTDAGAIVEIHRAMGELNQAVVDRLQEAEVPALPVRPLSVARRTDSSFSLASLAIEAMLLEEFVPVLHGDVLIHEGSGSTIISGDELVVELARLLDATRVGLCSTVPGVLDDEGAVIEEVTTYEAVSDVLGESESTDVTGGMAAKVKELLALSTPAAIFDPDELAKFLDSGEAGTMIR